VAVPALESRDYAVREELKTYNQRLLDYVKNGGNLIVFYNTQEFVRSRPGTSRAGSNSAVRSSSQPGTRRTPP